VWREVYGAEPEAAPAYDPGWAESTGREHMAEAAARHLAPVAPNDIQCADLLLFRWRSYLPAKHAAILTGPLRMIHAQEGRAVCEVALSEWWRRRLAFAFRFPGVE
jgi:NlpC/P60 family putative phage cell wall peptidase